MNKVCVDLGISVRVRFLSDKHTLHSYIPSGHYIFNPYHYNYTILGRGGLLNKPQTFTATIKFCPCVNSKMKPMQSNRIAVILLPSVLCMMHNEIGRGKSMYTTKGRVYNRKRINDSMHQMISNALKLFFKQIP